MPLATTGPVPSADDDQRVLGVPIRDWIWIFALSAWRIALGSRLGLGVDEAHYVLYGLRVDWSYFDHPPLVGWIHFAFLQLFGQSEATARMPAILCGALSSALAYRLAWRATSSAVAARLAALALNASFMAAALWLMFLPDSILVPLAFWLVDAGSRAAERGRWRDWLETGACLGLCGLTKYTSIFFVASLGAFFIQERAIRRAFSAQAIASAALSLAIVSPVFLWNWSRDWISFKYQTGHVLGGAGLNPKSIGLFALGQFGAYSPFLIVCAAIGWYARSSRLRSEATPAARRARLAAWIALPTFAFFAYAALREEVLPHWTLVPWALLLPLGIAFAYASGWRRSAIGTVAATGSIALVAMAELSAQFVPFPDWQSPYADLTGWRETHRDVTSLAAAQGEGFTIAVPNWTLGSRANYYLSDLAPVFVLDDRFDQFDLWEGGPPKTQDLLVLEWRGFELSPERRSRCERWEPAAKRTFLSHGRPVNKVEMHWCRNYR